MGASTEKLDSILRWLGHGWLIFQILIALGIGKMLKAVLATFTKVPDIWITPLWIFASAVALAVLLLVGRKFSRKSDQQSSSQAASTLAIPHSNFDATDHFKRAYNSAIREETENNIRAAALQNQPNDREGFYVRLLAIGIHEYIYDMAWAYIYRSQILLLMALNQRLLTIAEAKTYYDKAVEEYPANYANYSFDQWLNYLKEASFILQFPSGMVDITLRGKDFLKYLTHWGRYPDARKF